MLGDEGSGIILHPLALILDCFLVPLSLGSWFTAYWVAHTAVKTILDEEDNRRTPPYSTKMAKETMLEHFQIKDR